MSSQGQALPAQASPTSPPTLLSCPHLLPPAVFLCTLFLLPALDTALLSLDSPFCLSSEVPLPLLRPFFCLTLCLYLSLPPTTPTPTGALCVLKLRGWQPESTPPHPPTHARLGRSSHNTVTASPSTASAVVPLTCHCLQVQFQSRTEATQHCLPTQRGFPVQLGRQANGGLGVENEDKGIRVGGKGAAGLVTGQRPSRNVIRIGAGTSAAQLCCPQPHQALAVAHAPLTIPHSLTFAPPTFRLP